MKAVFYEKYGAPEVLKVKEVPINYPQVNEILIKNYASSITKADTFLRKGEPKFGRLFLGLFKPKNKMMGTGFAGIVKEVGKNVTAFKVGDRVFGETTFGFGAHAEYTCVDIQKQIVRLLPQELTFQEAAPLCDGVLTSFNFLVELGKIQAGHHVLINGASGALGTAAIQIAKSVGAKVTAVCSAKNSSLVKKMGADVVIDYKKNDFNQQPNLYDIVYDAIGKSSFSKSKKSLKKKGMYLSPVLSFSLLLKMLQTRFIGNKKAIFQATGLRKKEELHQQLDKIDTLIKEEKLNIFIDRRYTIDQIVAAHNYLDSERKRGNIILDFEQ